MKRKINTSNNNGYGRNNSFRCKTKNHGQLQSFYKQRRLFVGRFKESQRHHVGCNSYLNALFVDLIDWETGRKCDYSWVMEVDWPTGKRGVAEMRPGKTWTFSGVVDIYDTKGFDDYNITLVDQPIVWEDWNEVMDVCDDMGFHGPPPEYSNFTTGYDYGADNVPK